MTTIERNFDGTVYSLAVKERRMAMGEDSTLQAPEEAGSAGAGGPSSGLEESSVKVISLEVKVGQERGVLLQRWQQEGGEEGEEQVNKGHSDNMPANHKQGQPDNSKVRFTKEGLGGVTAAEVKASIFIFSFCIFNIITFIILSIIHLIILLRRCLPFSKTG